MKKIFPVFILLLLTQRLHAQQDPLYSQYMQNMLVVNPGYTGSYNMFSATVINRLQWVGLEGAPVTNTIAAHSSFFKSRMGAGVIFLNDRFGISNNTEMHGTLAYKLRLSDNEDHVLSFGMVGSITNYNYAYSDLRIKYPDDPNLPDGRQISNVPNLGAGIYYRHEKMYAGVSIPKFMNYENEEKLPTIIRYRRHLFVTGGFIVDLNNVILKPSFLVRYVEGAPISYDINGNILLKDILWLGVSLRNLNSTILMAQLQVTDVLRLGYSLDIPLTSVIRASYGTHELMLNIDLKLLKSHNIGLRYF